MPIYQDNLLLFATHLRHDSVPRDAVVTYALTEGTTEDTASNWAEALQLIFQTAWKALLDDNLVITKTTCVKGIGTDAPLIGESTAAGTRGTFSGSKLPPNCAVLIKKRTGYGGRNHRGRIYLPWSLNENDVDEAGAFAGAALTQRQTAADNWLDAMTDGANFWPVIAHREYDLPWDNPNRTLVAVSSDILRITSLFVEDHIATQRRRMIRG